MKSTFEKKRDFTIKEIWDLLKEKGAGRDSKSSIRIWDYKELIPNNKFLNGLKKIGQGAFGYVYVINIDGLEYALKIMTQKVGQSQQELIDNFYNECKQVLSVNHQRVLRILGVAIDTSQENNYCFCHYSNYQRKGNLFNLIVNKQLFSESPVGSEARFIQKINLLGQIAEGLHAIHVIGLIHRDIKSANILLDENDSPKIADLGIAVDMINTHTSLIRGSSQ